MPTDLPDRLFSESPWWQGAVVYQIYPRSFCDTSGDGVGDLDGIRRHLDHLVWLGVDALWLSPIFPSPMADHGYDVADHCDVDPRFGSLATLDALVGEAHQRDLRVLLDWVPCHTSDRHPWFLEARSSRRSPLRDWYVWRDGSPDRPPNGWTAMFPEGPAWTWDTGTEAWYYHRFTPWQPDLNWTNPEVRAAMLDTLRFWLDRGVDGFRMDVVHKLGKDLSRIDTGEGEGPDDPAMTHELLREIRRVVDAYPGDRVAVGEVYILDVDEAASYVGTGPAGHELHLGFNFVAQFLPWEAGEWREQIGTVDRAYGARLAWPTWVLSNHDIPRHRTRLGSEARARAAAVLLLGLRGTPFLYAGEELGLEDADVPPERRQDPAGFRDGCRAPVPWEPGPGYGWAGSEPWLPWPPHPAERSAAVQREDTGSILHLYRRMLAARRASPALRHGDQGLRDGAAAGAVAGWAAPPDRPAEPGEPGGDVVAWERRGSDGAGGVDVRLVAVNFAAERRAFDPGPPDPVAHVAGDHGSSGRAGAPVWVVEVSSDGGGEGRPFPGELAADQAVVLRPG